MVDLPLKGYLSIRNRIHFAILFICFVYLLIIVKHLIVITLHC